MMKFIRIGSNKKEASKGYGVREETPKKQNEPLIEAQFLLENRINKERIPMTVTDWVEVDPRSLIFNDALSFR